METMVCAKMAACIGAALVVGIGVLGPALGQGAIGAKAVENIGKYPESASKIQTAMLVGMGMIESATVFALLIGGALVWVALTL